MSNYKFLKAIINGEQLQNEIRKAKVDLNLDDEQLVKLALIEFLNIGYESVNIS